MDLGICGRGEEESLWGRNRSWRIGDMWDDDDEEEEEESDGGGGEECEAGWWWKTEKRGLEGGGLGRRRGRATLSAIFGHRRASRGSGFCSRGLTEVVVSLDLKMKIF